MSNANFQASLGASAGSNLSMFAGSFMKPGRVYDQGEFRTTLSLEEVVSIIQAAFRHTFAVTGAGTYSCPMGGLNIQMIDDMGEFRFVKYQVMADSLHVRELKDGLSVQPYATPRKEGVYNIHINHWYLDKTQSASGEMKVIEHYRDTEDFEKLMVEMYPRIDIDEMMRQFSISEESLMILSGQPGTGKTCFAKMMMAAHALTQECDIDVVYAKDKELLKKDQFWALMSRSEPCMIILDDLDNELLPRGKEGNEIVSNMLSYSDGIFDVDTKILITTNLTDSKIDKALVRPGRSFDTLCLPQLSREEAFKIWTGKMGGPEAEFASRFEGLCTISQAALVSEHQRFLKSDAPTYLRDPSISVRKLVEEGETINHDEE